MPKPAKRLASVDTLIGYAENGIGSRYWYRDATAQIDFVSQVEKWDPAEFAGVLATTSPRCSVLRNIRMSLHFMKHRNDRVVPMESIRRSLNRFLDGDGIAGPKTNAFYHNLSGYYDYVTLDVWMAYALGIDQKDFALVKTHAAATDRVVEVARKLRIEPAEAQAAIWTGYRKLKGYNESPFSVVSEYVAARDNGWVITGCTTDRD